MGSRKIVVISDIHLHPWTAFSKGAGLHNSRLQQTLRVIEASLAKAHELEAVWICPGDFVHTHGYVQNVVLSKLGEVLSLYPEVPKLGIWGNHDARGSGGEIVLEETALWMLSRSVPNFQVLTKLEPFLRPDWPTIYGEGYQPRRELLELQEGPDIGVFHQTVIGTKNAFDYEFKEGIESDILMQKYRTVLVGHVHQPAHYYNDDTKKTLLIPGSPEHHNFGDAGEHGYWILTLEKESDGWYTQDAQLIPSGSPKFLTVEDVQAIQKNDGNFYRVLGGVKDFSALPENAIAVGSSETPNTQREAFKGALDPESIVQRWIDLNPPPEGLPKEEYVRVGQELLSSAETAVLGTYRLKYAVVKDFMSFASAELIVQDGIHLVTGQARDFQSNGAGKTSLFGEAAYWGLFGETTKGLSSDDVIRRGGKVATVELCLEDADGHEVIIERSRSKGSSKLNLTFDGNEYAEGSVSDRTKYLQKVLGITPEIYKILAYFSQEDLVLFSRATDSQRKDFIKDLTGTERFQQAASAAKAREKKANEAALTQRSRADTLRERREALQEMLRKAKADAASWVLAHEERLQEETEQLELTRKRHQKVVAFCDKKLTRIRELAKKANERLENDAERIREERIAEVVEELSKEHRARIAQFSQHVQNAKEEIEAEFGTVDKLRNLVKQMPMLETVGGKLRDEVTAAENNLERVFQEQAEFNAKLSKIDASIVRLTGSIEAKQSELARLERAVAQGVCPTCSQPVTATSPDVTTRVQKGQEEYRGLVAEHAEAIEQQKVAEADVERMQENVATAKQRVSDAKVKFEEARQAFQQLMRGQGLLQEHDRRVENVEAATNQIENYRTAAEGQVASELLLYMTQRRQTLVGRISRAQKFASDWCASWETRVATEAALVQRIQNEVNPYAELVASHIASDSTMAAEVEKADILLAEATREVDLFSYWISAFSRTGIQSLLVDEIANAFNAHRDKVFPVLTRGVYDVQFSTTSQTAAGELREKTEFQVREHGFPVPYEGLSGGQRRRVDLGVMLTLALALAHQYGTPGVLGMMVHDEVFGFLDDDGAEGLFETLKDVQKVIPAVYCITHDSHLQSLFPSVMVVEQDEDGVSRLQES